MDNRARRQRKTINYAALLEADDSDDDFVVSSAKPKADLTKLKIKPANAEKPRQHDGVAECLVTDSPVDVRLPKKVRLSRDEKLYQRDLEQALKLSVSEDLSVSEPDLDAHNPSSQDTVLLSSEESATATSVCTPPATEELHKSPPKIRTEVPEQLPSRVPESKDSEDESDVPIDLESSSSEDELEDKPLKTKTAKSVRKKTKADDKVKPKSNNNDKSRTTNDKVAPRPSAAVPPAATRNPCIKTPVWNPPGHSKDAKSLNSPASAASTRLRLGLSRKARVKPLHPGVQLKI